MVALFLSLAVYAALCLALARVYARTGHARGWQAACFAPLALAILAYALQSGGAFVMAQLILSGIVLCFLALLVVLAFKGWPVDRIVRVETFQ